MSMPYGCCVVRCNSHCLLVLHHFHFIIVIGLKCISFFGRVQVAIISLFTLYKYACVSCNQNFTLATSNSLVEKKIHFNFGT